MGQITITLPPELEHEIDEYLGSPRDEADLSRLVREALETYFAQQRSELRIVNPGRPHRFLRLPPGGQGSGASDVSINHDKYLAEAHFKDRSKE